MKEKKLLRRWKRRFRSGLRGVKTLFSECQRTGDPVAVHDLRVCLRRTRLLALVGKPVLGKAEATHFRQWALKLSTALGPVRDYDVALEWLKIHAPESERTRVVLQAARARTWRLTRRKLERLWPRKLKHVRPRPSLSVRPRKLRKNFLKQCSRIRTALAQDAPQFHQLNPAGRHEFRRTLRRLRYLRELHLRRRDQRTDADLKRLVAFQEALGEMQNCSIVRSFFASHDLTQRGRQALRRAAVQEQRWLKRARQHLREFQRDKANRDGS